jgi:alpha-N-arabinofuranosidase
VNGGEPIDTLMQANLGGTPVRRLRTVTHEDLMAWPERPMWMHMQSPIEANYERSDGRLRLHAGQPVAKTDHPTFIGMRQTSERMTVQVDVDAAHINEGDEAGIIAYQIDDGWQSLSCTRQNGELIVKLDCRLKTMSDIKTYKLDQSKAKLRISSDGLTYRYECSTDGGKTWHELGSQSCTLLSTEMAGGFTGVVLALYAQGSKESYADFTNFGYQEY